MSELSDFLNEFREQNRKQNAALAYYLKEQFKQQSQTPITSPPITFNLLCSSDSAIQVLPRNDLRFKVGLANFGPSDVIYSIKHFKPLEILNHFSDPNNPNPNGVGYNQAVEIGWLPAGTNVDLNSIQAVWMYNVDSAYSDASNINAIVSLQDSLYQGILDVPAMPLGHEKAAWKADTVSDSMHVGSVN